ncbi:MAG: DMT family transporter [Galactobacter sp.]
MTQLVWPAICCALISAVFIAVGTQRQSMGVLKHLAETGVTPRSTLTLLGSWTWLSGLGLLGLGMVLNVAALTMAPIMVVQPLGCIALVLTSLINARYERKSITKATWISITVCVLGSVAFVLLAIGATHENPIDLNERWLVIAIMAVVALVFGGGAFLRRRRSGGAVFYIVGAGILFGLTAVLVRTIALAITRWDHDVPFWEQLPWAPLVAVVVAAVLGQYFNQHAYAVGSPDLVIAGLTVIDPMVCVIVGVTILGELQPGVSALHGLGLAAAALVAIVGVVMLSRNRTRTHPGTTRAGNAAGPDGEHNIGEPRLP